ncbi:hypothetical protein EFK50_10040 [Nocardioides marmoriginsengisoli]|uniref:Uncharacterized protein n=1 Tax=Nocardioides marmoriginsengisoli TaxID=661483 RepID=A0A3N0CFB0_9ACTN|nr:hypothetical protein [Nocardioides marmoriginsengisoli]RNL62135.1 hypothetical protein EFK50_10040 [Nocardioides marmoriginsengisoli]
MTEDLGVIMLVIALALVLIAAACAAVLMDATRSMLPGVTRPVSLPAPLAVPAAPALPVQRSRETSPDAQADAAHRAYSYVAALPTEPSPALRASL